MQVLRFSPRISLIKMAPRSGCPGRLALPCLSPQTDRAVDGFPEGASQAFQTTMLFPMANSAAET